jgi:hypothetical protein
LAGFPESDVDIDAEPDAVPTGNVLHAQTAG